jgi:putative copper resistance protein D
VDDPLIVVRAVHFAATLTLAGVAIFNIFVARPALRLAGGEGLRGLFSRQLALIVWSALALTLLSGAAWFILLAQSISDQSLADVLADGVGLRMVLLETDFGRDWLARLGLVVVLALLLAGDMREKRDGGRLRRLVILLAAAGLAGTLAWAGHGVGGSGISGNVHLAADFLHLAAAAAWVGGLLPLALLLAAAQRASAMEVARAASLRFSACGVAAVGALVLTGAVNTWYLAGSLHALSSTDYGRLLLVKIALFLVMLALAIINRLRLTPALTDGKPAGDALRQLRRNVVVEIATGALIIAVVAVLGVTPPAIGE